MTGRPKLRHRLVYLEDVRAILEQVGRDLTAQAGQLDPLDRLSVNAVEGQLDLLDCLDERLRRM